jgi:hypothetical protein
MSPLISAAFSSSILAVCKIAAKNKECMKWLETTYSNAWNKKMGNEIPFEWSESLQNQATDLFCWSVVIFFSYYRTCKGVEGHAVHKLQLWVA